MQMINTGHPIWTIAVSDAHEITRGGVGGWRTYLPSRHDAPADIDPKEVIDHAKAGHSFVTNGPFIEVKTADGHGPGETVTLRNGDVIPASEPYTPIVFWNFPDEEQKKAGRGAFVRFYQVWNTEQVDGIEEPVAKALGDIEQTHKDPIAEGEALVKGYAGGPVISNGSSRAFYTPGTDQVTMPEMQAFESAESYYRVLFHELTHSTGHRTRLERDGVANPAAFASHAYSEEELIAEMGASMLAGFAGIGSEAADENSAAYLDHWLRKLRAEPKMLMAAGGAAQKAIDHIRGIKWEKAA